VTKGTPQRRAFIGRETDSIDRGKKKMELSEPDVNRLSPPMKIGSLFLMDLE